MVLHMKRESWKIRIARALQVHAFLERTCLLEVIVLGCGTSTGVPLIGCRCPICTSDHPRNKRLRTSVWMTWDGRGILVDTSTDLRFQAIRYGIPRVDAVLFTHSHADHIHGIDELRLFNALQKGQIPCFGSSGTARLSQAGIQLHLRAGRQWAHLYPASDASGDPRPIPVV